MGVYIEPVLNEEQMAAYFDGMLTDEDSLAIELLTTNSPTLAEILNAIDAVDTAYIENAGGEVPLECMADDFVLPDVDDGDFMPAEDDSEQADFADDGHDADDLCTDDGFDDFSF